MVVPKQPSGPRKEAGVRLNSEAREKLRVRVLRWIAERERFSFHTIHQRHRVACGIYVLPAEMRSILGELERQHMIEKLPRRRTGRRGRQPSQEWRVSKERVAKALAKLEQEAA